VIAGPADSPGPGSATWVEPSERLASTGRRLLTAQGAESTRYLDLFAATDSALVEALTSRTLTGILTRARDARNAWTGHGGVAGRRNPHVEAAIDAIRGNAVPVLINAAHRPMCI
jgi:hypothetical protein